MITESKPCPVCLYGKIFPMVHVRWIGNDCKKSEPWVECEDCHTISDYVPEEWEKEE